MGRRTHLAFKLVNIAAGELGQLRRDVLDERREPVGEADRHQEADEHDRDAAKQQSVLDDRLPVLVIQAGCEPANGVPQVIQLLQG